MPSMRLVWKGQRQWARTPSIRFLWLRANFFSGSMRLRIARLYHWIAYGYRDDEYFFLKIRQAFPGNTG